MSSQNDYRNVYEQVLKPAIDQISDPFMSKDLDIDIPVKTIGRTLNKISQDENYELEIVDRPPYVFSRHGRTPLNLRYSQEAINTSQRIVQILEEEKLSSSEVEDLSHHLLDDSISLSARISKTGEVKDHLRELEDVEYFTQKDEYKIKD